MPLELVTQQDLLLFREKLIAEIKAQLPSATLNPKLLKTTEVCRILKLSPGTIQSLRKNGTLAFTKLGGTYYYSYDDIIKIVRK